ncbi:TetR/AcrR family transcriptional regulator [Pseudogemmobacter humi]|uniref:Transposon Tn10 TetC protein n=1 Tax=Pseudogemmobacter humi TaxID=2483812 RepID=A0A3P5XPQ8_9RHOB|nr:TetR/AcrR family transcriptional regulator [Pseudogemmobacter humi]VDC30766.1 Transposon Tn10 TetC protein [Pseudogemmobacter humi]
MKETRRRQPEILRRKLLDAATALAVREGVHSVTIGGVARAAGVTKGGLFHHFPDKDALLQAMFLGQLEELDAAIDAEMAADEGTPGCFTRAYVLATLQHSASPAAPLFAVLLMSPAMRAIWSDWLRARLGRHAGTDGGAGLELVRYAADGIWLSDLWQVDPGLRASRAELRDTLLQSTRRNPT